MTNAIKVLLQMTSVSLQPVPSFGTFKTTLFDIHFPFLLQIETFISSKFLFLMH
jgi:hypothetical protein